MKKIFRLPVAVLISFCFVFAACSDDDDEPRASGVNGFTIEASGNVINMDEGDTYQIRINLNPTDAWDAEEYTFTYKSLNPNIFTVDEDGLVTAVGIGEASLRVVSVKHSDMWATCIVEVGEKLFPVESIQIPSVHTMKVDNSFDLSEVLAVFPENASNKQLIFTSSDDMVATVDDTGMIHTHELGTAVITVLTTDGSGVNATCTLEVKNTEYNPFDRIGWGVFTSHPTPVDSAVGGEAENIIDDSEETCMLLVKPGKSLGGITVASDEEVWFTVDMGTSRAFNYFRLRHRTSNNTVNLRIHEASIYGSDDNENFTEIMANIDIPVQSMISAVVIDLPQAVRYRYLRVRVDAWSNSGNTVQVSDFHIGNMIFVD